jgi:hypothetical protein
VNLEMMWLAVWVPVKVAGSQLNGSTNQIIDAHMIGVLAHIVVE